MDEIKYHQYLKSYNQNTFFYKPGFILIMVLLMSSCGGGSSLPPKPNVLEITRALCSDGINNDGNNQVDCNDSNCSNTSFCSANGEEWLWTTIKRTDQTQQIVVRLNEGALPPAGKPRTGNVTATLNTTLQQFRCIWPINVKLNTGFTKERCHTKPGENCFKVSENLNMDSKQRAPLDYAGAAQECRMSGASLPVVADYADAIQAGFPHGTNSWNYTTNAISWFSTNPQNLSNNSGISIVRFNDKIAPYWSYINGDRGSIAHPGTIHMSYRFRCIGLEDSSRVTLASEPACQDGQCFQLNDARSMLIADNTDRTATTFAVALDTCREVGADIPNQAV